jgi:hypothetical protein
VRGADPLLYAIQKDMGVLNATEFTPLIECKMSAFQEETYMNQLEVLKERHDALSKSILSICNISLPGLSGNKKDVVGYFSNEGISEIIRQLKKNELLLVMKKRFPKLNMRTQGGRIKGNILHLDNLHEFSCKYHRAMLEINTNVEKQKGPGTVFVYASAVVAGVAIFEEVLNENGYMAYNPDLKKQKAVVPSHVKCAVCGVPKGMHKDTESHMYAPSCYISFTGDNESTDSNNKGIIQSTFNHPSNINGSLIKVLIGSSVMKEGISLYNVKEVHILDTPYTLTRLDQVIGRAIRFCSHIAVMSPDNPYPEVRVYRYAAVLSKKKKDLTIDQSIYRDAEAKYKVIKKIEQKMQEGAVDCPLLIEGNIFPEEVEKHKNCDKKGTCPVTCNFQECRYKCSDRDLNKLFLEKDGSYKSPKEFNDVFFTKNILEDEIQFAKNIIKDLYRKRMTYTLNLIVQQVKDEYPEFKKNFFDPYFVYKALDSFVPNTDNDKNNFKDPILDMQDRPGYLVHRGEMYIFQPNDIPEDASIKERGNMEMPSTRQISLETYLRFQSNSDIDKYFKDKIEYKFDEKYYSDRQENDIVGIIDISDEKDVFNIRSALKKDAKKKREKGLATIRGAACTSKSIEELIKIVNILSIKGLSTKDQRSKIVLCRKIKQKLFMLEKFAKGADKKTHLKVPSNHPIIYFPLNLEDRYQYIQKSLSRMFYERADVRVEVSKDNKYFRLHFRSDTMLPDDKRYLQDNRAIKSGKNMYDIYVDQDDAARALKSLQKDR